MVKNNNQKSKEKTPLPTPPRSGSGLMSRRASPRGHSSSQVSGISQKVQLQTESSQKSPLMSSSVAAMSISKMPGAQKRKVVSEGASRGMAVDDVICPICDDVCTCTEQFAQQSSGQASGWSSPIVIKDHQHPKQNHQQNKKQMKTSHTKDKKASMTKARRDKIDKKADTMAQFVLSEYYFSMPDDHFLCSEDEEECEEVEGHDEYYNEYEDDEDGCYTSDISEIDEIMFELSEGEDEETARKMKELLLTKVNSVIGNEWIATAESDENNNESGEEGEFYYFFDPVDAANLVVHLPVPAPSPIDPSQTSEDSNLSNLTPQVLAAISAAAKTLTAATQHYTRNPGLPFCRDSAKQVAFVFDDSQQQNTSGSGDVSIDDLIDTSQLHGSSPLPHLTLPKRWDRIPVSCFRKRRLSVPRNVLPANAIKHPPPEPPSSTFAQLHISDDTHHNEGFQLLILTRQQDRERRATIDESALISSEATIEVRAVVEEQTQTQTQSDQKADYWVHGYDDTDFYWLGEHFRTQA